MSRKDELLKLAQLFHSQARLTLDRSAKQVLRKLGDHYQNEATVVKRDDRKHVGKPTLAELQTKLSELSPTITIRTESGENPASRSATYFKTVCCLQSPAPSAKAANGDVHSPGGAFLMPRIEKLTARLMCPIRARPRCMRKTRFAQNNGVLLLDVVSRVEADKPSKDANKDPCPFKCLCSVMLPAGCQAFLLCLS
jgi:hypothetical protein